MDYAVLRDGYSVEFASKSNRYLPGVFYERLAALLLEAVRNGDFRRAGESIYDTPTTHITVHWKVVKLP